LAGLFATGVKRLGFSLESTSAFDTVSVKADSEKISKAAFARQINVRNFEKGSVQVSIDEATSSKHLNELLAAFAEVAGLKLEFSIESLADEASVSVCIPESSRRTSAILTHPIFNSHHSETEMMRYLFKLQSKDLSLQTAMIPLGSCTMKLNAASEMIPVTWPTVNKLHPFCPDDQVEGYSIMLERLGTMLVNLTGFHAISFQPNSGSQGEYAGLLAIRAYHASRGESHRNVCLIPTSAHGTNPASAALAGFKIVVVKCDEDGNIDIADLQKKAEENKEKY
jgi:glycine dehydrogenase